jgi:hypothetical protein
MFMRGVRSIRVLVAVAVLLGFPSWGAAQIQQEIGLINFSPEAVSGTLRIMSREGQELTTCPVTLPGWGKAQWATGQQDCSFPSDDALWYAMFVSDSMNMVGYGNSYIEQGLRTSTPMRVPSPQNELYVPFIPLEEWLTEITVINTTDQVREISMQYNTGDLSGSMSGPVNPGETKNTAIFNCDDCVGIESARIQNVQGFVGNQQLIFTNPAEDFSFIMGDTLPLPWEHSTRLVFPHVAHNWEWWTGIVIFNPNNQPANLAFQCHAADGTLLDTITPEPLAAGANLTEDPETLGLPEGTAWFAVESDVPLAGYVTYQALASNQFALVPLTGVDTVRGVFPKVDPDGWTGIALVNPGAETVVVDVFARSNGGGDPVAESSFTMGPGQKLIGLAADFFDMDISHAAYIYFEVRDSENAALVGLQLNGSSDMHLLDGLPVLSAGGPSLFVAP